MNVRAVKREVRWTCGARTGGAHSRWWAHRVTRRGPRLGAEQAMGRAAHGGAMSGAKSGRVESKWRPQTSESMINHQDTKQRVAGGVQMTRHEEEKPNGEK